MCASLLKARLPFTPARTTLSPPSSLLPASRVLSWPSHRRSVLALAQQRERESHCAAPQWNSYSAMEGTQQLESLFLSLSASKDEEGMTAVLPASLEGSSWLDEMAISGAGGQEGNATISYSPASPAAPDSRRRHLSLSGSLEGMLGDSTQRASLQRSSTEIGWLHPHAAFELHQQTQQQTQQQTPQRDQPFFAPGWSVSPSHSMDWQPQHAHPDATQHQVHSLSTPTSALARSSSGYSGSSSRSIEDVFCMVSEIIYSAGSCSLFP